MSRSLHGATLAFCVALGCLGARAANAQQNPPLDQATRATEEFKLRERERPTLHPGSPLNIVGLEAEGNDLRSKTPALQQGNRTAAQVDPEALYRRTLAMYDSGARFNTPPALAVAPTRVKPTPAAAPTPTEDVLHRAAGRVALLVILSLALAGIAWMIRKSTSDATEQ